MFQIGQKLKLFTAIILFSVLSNFPNTFGFTNLKVSTFHTTLIQKYCNFDVHILRYGCLEPRKQYLKITIINLFQYMTIAGVYIAIYRSKI
ncbi:hypothetical protein V1478_013534 [Vespula squamosa]|uniref:Uncharacterized protein n=1 Tax=Vespula squamosa TaxID=30214 RepID=A0ABD2A5F2_VESSQ